MTGPATVPLWSVTLAFPFTEELVATDAPTTDPVMYAPPPGPFMVKVTAVPSAAALPLMSRT